MTWDNIPSVETADITEQDIAACEKVIKCCAEAQWTVFSEADAIDVLTRTANVLRWALYLPMITYEIEEGD